MEQFTEYLACWIEECCVDMCLVVEWVVPFLHLSALLVIITIIMMIDS